MFIRFGERAIEVRYSWSFLFYDSGDGLKIVHVELVGAVAHGNRDVGALALAHWCFGSDQI